VLLLRDARRSDLPDLLRLARVLDSVNLPADPKALAGIVGRSARSFAGRIADPLQRSYVFVLEDTVRGRVLGTSMVIAQHGTRESPCTFLDVAERESYSSTLDRHFRHQVLSIGFHFDGPTEIGGLVVDPRSRGGAAEPGKQLSFVRFLFMAAHPERFRETVLAELMPPLVRNGKSLFWESFGRRFTGLGYQEADKLSRRGKEFIQQLFPAGEFYATLLPPRVQRALGKVGRSTEPARRMLARLGFRYVDRIDPFDGGPHYEARLADVTLVKAYRRVALDPAPLAPGGRDPEVLAGVLRPSGPNRFRAVRTRARVTEGSVRLPAEASRALGARPGQPVHLIPFS
jgi:arginine N-succinyltransferase